MFLSMSISISRFMSMLLSTSMFLSIFLSILMFCLYFCLCLFLFLCSRLSSCLLPCFCLCFCLRLYFCQGFSYVKFYVFSILLFLAMFCVCFCYVCVCLSDYVSVFVYSISGQFVTDETCLFICLRIFRCPCIFTCLFVCVLSFLSMLLALRPSAFRCLSIKITYAFRIRHSMSLHHLLKNCLCEKLYLYSTKS